MHKYKITSNMAGLGKSIKYGLILFISVANLISCHTGDNRKKKPRVKKKQITDTSSVNSNYYTMQGPNLRLKADNNNIITMPKDSVFDYEHPYKGIYSVTNADTLNHIFCTKTGNMLYFTTIYDDVGMDTRGGLHVFDLEKRKFVYDPVDKSKGIASPVGVFFIDGNYVFSFEHPVWFERKQTMITGADVYKMKNDKFYYLKTVYMNGDKARVDSDIADFYNKKLKGDNWKKAKEMPKWRNY